MDYELTILSQAMSEAGREALRLAAAGFETFTKSDHSPVTSSDLAVNQILHDRLATRFPEDGWLSEETADNEERLSRKRVWIVDPIDGTRSFVRGLPEFCLSVALVENGCQAGRQEPRGYGLDRTARPELIGTSGAEAAFFEHSAKPFYGVTHDLRKH